MDADVLQRALDREKARRKKAETLLEDRSRELFMSYESLNQSHTELAAAMEDVKNKQHQLVQSEKMASLGVMSAGVAHEINNPLAFVFSNVNSLGHAVGIFTQYHQLVEAAISADTDAELKTSIKPLAEFSKESDLSYLVEDCTDLIAETSEGIDRVKSIVAGLQLFARSDTGTMETVNIHDCINSTLKIVHNQLVDTAEVKLELEEIPEINGYPGQLGQVFLNLLVNAGHAMGDKRGEITVSTHHLNNNIKITVSDTGSGMEQSTIDNIFTPFFTTKEVGKGTGLGLSISHGIIEDHQGTIEVESSVGEGTTFTVILPVPQTASKAA